MLSRTRFIFTLTLAGICSLSHLASATCRSAKCASDIKNVASGNVSVIVQFSSVLPAQVSATSQIVSSLGKLTRNLTGINGIALSLPAQVLDTVAALPSVSAISLDHPVGARGTISTSPEFTAEPINAPRLWGMGYDGSGIGVAVIDSGITVTNDLAQSGTGKKATKKVVYSQNFVANETTTNDLYGHGTHVAGLISGTGVNSTGKTFTRTFTGVAPGSSLINLRVLDENGAGSDSAVIAAIDTAIQLKSIYNIRVINLSLGRPIYTSYLLDPLCQEVELAWKAGIIVVAAAGNDGRDLALNTEGYGTIEAPGNDPYALTVGAVRTGGTPAINDDAMASYSSKGPTFIDQIVKPDIVAPGNLVTSIVLPGTTLPTENPTFNTPMFFYVQDGTSKPSQDYFPLSGTSMATGVASGAVGSASKRSTKPYTRSGKGSADGQREPQHSTANKQGNRSNHWHNVHRPQRRLYAGCRIS